MSRAITSLPTLLFLLFVAGCGRSQLGVPGDLPDGDLPDSMPVACDTNSDCDDGNVCNGSETCVAGACRPGTAIVCDDGVECTDDTCDSETGDCFYLPNHDLCGVNALCDPEEGCRRRACDSAEDCDDGFFCNGHEFCAAGFCEAGAPADCNDGIDCTDDICDDDRDECVSRPVDRLCDDGRFCNGSESCDTRIGCIPGRPIDCDDGIDCTDEFCDDTIDACVFEPTDADRDGFADCDCAPPPCDCDDSDVTVNPGMREQCRDRRDNNCDGLTDCEDIAACGSDPRCGTVTCTDDADCMDGVYCNGRESCDATGVCRPGPAPACSDTVFCTIDFCDEASRSCLFLPDDDLCPVGETCDAVTGCTGGGCRSDAECDDGVFCNGAETCLDDGTCGSGPVPDCADPHACTDDRCDLARDRCVHSPDDSLCDNGLFCDGVETCSSRAGCVPGEDPCVATGCSSARCLEDEDRCVFRPIDADGDTYVDAACGGDDCDDDNPLINPGAAEICTDGDDNDCNGDTDCDDAACDDEPMCCIPTGPEECDDGIDNDCDTYLDCDDLADCRTHIACCVPTGPELCDDDIDNDCDGFTDCSDFIDCRTDPVCDGCFPELCWDGDDNDCDTFVDCDDPDCAWYPPCTAPPFETECHNGIDDDMDGDTDCDDTDCDADPMCPEPDTCADAIRLPGPGTYTGNTSVLDADYLPDTSAGDPDCRGGRGADAVYELVVRTPTWVRIDTFGSAYDTVLYVRADPCETGTQLECNDDTGGLQSEVLFEALRGIYYVFVDGYGFSSDGEFELTIEFVAAPTEVCDNFADDDGDGMVDCDDPDCIGDPACIPVPERGVAGCTDGRDNDLDGLVDCDDEDDCAVLTIIGECCDGIDDNGNGVVDEFACACDPTSPCDSGYCYEETAGACGPSCTMLGGDVVCDWFFPGSHCSAATNTCVY